MSALIVPVFLVLGAVLGYQLGSGACLGAGVALALLVATRPRPKQVQARDEVEVNEETVPPNARPHACPVCRKIVVFHRHEDGRACVEHWGTPCEWYMRPETTAEVVASRIELARSGAILDRSAAAN